nr:unnamed protein product [Leishmania braziliensis]
MSSDFESLSCNLESSENRQRHGDSTSASSDFDTLDDLVTEQNAQLLCRLDVHSASPGSGDRLAPSPDHSNQRTSSAYGYRDYGVTGEVAATVPAARGAHQHHRCSAAAQSDDCGRVHLFIKDPTSCCRPPATATRGDVKGTHTLDNLEGEFAPTVVTPRDTRTASWAAAAATTTAANVSASRGGELASVTQRQATCPPDSVSPTRVHSAATLTASATTRRTHDSSDDEGCADDGKVEKDRADLEVSPTVQRRQLTHGASAAAAASRPPQPLSTVTPYRSARDLDGFYNTGLLLEDDDNDDDAATRDLSRRHALVVDSAVAPPPPSAVPGASLFHRHRSAGRYGNNAPISWQRLPATTAAPDPYGGAHCRRPASPTSIKASTATVPRSWSIASRRKAAGDQLCRLAVVLPTMTTVHWLSLVITLLVPVNLLCLDVMALGWIRRRVDASYGGASALPSYARSTAPLSPRVVIFCGAEDSTGAAAAAASSSSSLSCPSGSEFGPSVDVTTVTSTSVGGSSDTASADNSGGVGTLRPSSSSAHTVPALCSVILWLLVPNGLLCRLAMHRLRRPSGERVADETKTVDKSVVGSSPSVGVAAAAAPPSTPSPPHQISVASTDEYQHLKAEWRVCCDAYERARQLAPQLKVIELFIQYAFLWVMVYAPLPCATAAGEWAEAWLLTVPAPEEETATTQNGSDWGAARNPTTLVSPRCAAGAIVTA